MRTRGTRLSRVHAPRRVRAFGDSVDEGGWMQIPFDTIEESEIGIESWMLGPVTSQSKA